MVTVFQAIRAAQNAVVCPILGANDYVLGSVGGFIPGLNVPALTAIRGLRRLYGCPESGDVVDLPVPFTGGQCPGIRYQIPCTSSVSRPGCPGGPGAGPGGPVNALSPIVRGPVTGVGVRPIANGECGPTVIEHFIRAFDAVGNPVDVGHTPVPSGRSDRTVTVSPSFGAAIALDTEPGDCGDPDPVFPPPTNFETNIDITYNIDNGDEVTVTIPFVYAPITANFDGTLRIPFNFDFGGFEYSGNINLTPTLEVSINPPSLPSAPEVNPEDFDPIPGEEVEPAPPEEKIIGVVVNVLDADGRRVSEIFSEGIPKIYAPRAGSVKFAYSFGGATFWSSDIDIKGERTFIECPFSQGADAVVASPQTGVQLSFVPIRGLPLATTGDIRALA